MKSNLWLLFFFALSACTPKQEVAGEVAPAPPRWVESRPLSSMYYIGIGVAQKSPNTNFQRVSRENALSDLASEIKVNVNTNSLLYTLEREYKFEQEFRETVTVTSNLDLEDFELVEVWEDDNSYWSYYRLDKQTYSDKQRLLKESAQNLALDFYAKGLSAQSSYQFRGAADSYLRGLQALESFWGESNIVDFQGSAIQLDNVLYTALRDLLSNARLQLEEDIVLSYQNGFDFTAQVRASDGRNDIALEDVPLQYEYFGIYGRVRGKATSNADGRAEIRVNQAERERNNNLLITSVDTDFIFEPFQSDRFMRRLTESMRSNSLQSLIKYVPPSMYFDAAEKNLGENIGTTPLTASIKTSLGRRGVRFTNNPQEADLTVTLRADTRQGGSDQGFFTSFMDLDIAIRNNTTGERVYSVSRSDLRGVDLDFERAGMKAYQNVTRNIESELMRKLVNDLF